MPGQAPLSGNMRERFVEPTTFGLPLVSVWLVGLFSACTADLGGTGGSGEEGVGSGNAGGETPPSGDDVGTGDGDISGDGDGERPPAFDPLGGVDPTTCDGDGTTFGTPRVWRLTRRQYDATVSALLYDDTGPAQDFLPEPGSEQGFQNDAYQLRVRSTEAGQFQVAAKRLANAVVSNHLTDIVPCAMEDLGSDTCKTSFIQQFGARAFRRPLSPEEIVRYDELFSLGLTQGGGELAVSVTVEAMLQSPYFLYRFELGDFDPAAPAPTTLTQHEIAAAISYYITEGPPDEDLRAAAEEGLLGTPEERRAQAERLRIEQKGNEAHLEFFRQLLEYAGLDQVMKDETVFPEFSDLRDEFHEEMQQFVGHVLFEDSGTLETLLTADYTFANQTLGEFLGLSVSGDEFSQSFIDPSQRSGLLSLTGLNAATSAQTRTSPVNRGRFVREKLLCDHIPDPPEGTDTNLPELEPGMTARQQLELRTSPIECAGCHSVMNPVGFGWESLDALGRYRTEENGLPIDTSGELVGTRDIDGPFTGVRELSEKLAQSGQVQECLVIQSYRYAFGRGENRGDSCAISEVRDAFVATDGDLSRLPQWIVSTDAFVNRAPQ